MLFRSKGLIEAFLKKHDDLVFKVYTDMKEGKRILVEPYVLTDDEFARRWQEKKYTGGKFEEDDPAYYTKRGDRVRSKSEQIIADRLFDAGVPYRYEYPFVYDSFEGKKQIFTDFTALNRRTRTAYRWEHFGRMDDPKYRKTFFWKQSVYSQNKWTTITLLPPERLRSTTTAIWRLSRFSREYWTRSQAAL